jgi:hypothetical protein
MTQELLKWLSTVNCWTVVVRETMLAFLLDKTIVDNRQNKIFVYCDKGLNLTQ